MSPDSHSRCASAIVGLLSLTLLLFGSGCSDSAAGGGCAGDDDCPSGQSCVSGSCVAAVDGDAGEDTTELPEDTASDGDDMSPDAEVDVEPDGDATDMTGDSNDVVDPCATCESPEECCDDRCYDPGTSVVHCGGCGNNCLAADGVAAATCEQGACIIDACLPGFADCDGNPANGCEAGLNQPDSCGGCGVSCGQGEVCNNGQCVCGNNTANGMAACGAGDVCCSGECVPPGDPACTCSGCAANEICCDGTCLDASTDLANCGGCGIACQPGEVCASGQCGCSGGQLGDDNNCGSCGNVCPGGTTCNNGVCECPGGGQLGDDSNCASCGDVCTDGQSCTGGACTCPNGQLNDTQNCGSCGTACPQGSTCDLQQGGGYACSCPVSADVCSGVCVDLDNDSNNCGSCGNVCGSGSTTNPVCLGGTCYRTCKPDRGNCDGLNFNGCEVDLTSRDSCGANCTTRVYCGWNDMCSTSGGTAHCECDDGNICNPGENCDPQSNGVDVCECGGGSACSSGQWCCPDGILSRGCVDVQTDDDNCGACGVECSSGESCVNGTCQ